MSARLATAVTIHMSDGESRLLLPGYEPTAEEAALITNPACWVGGVLPSVDVATPVSVADPSGGDVSADASDVVLPDSSWSKADIEAWVKSNGLDLPAGLKKEDLLTAIEAWAEQQQAGEEVENAAADSGSVGDTQ